MTAAALRQRRFRERIREGRAIYAAELNVKATDDLVYDAGHKTFGDLCQELLELDARLRRVTCDRRGLAYVLRSIADELRTDEDKTP
jgi:hypothetical protein